jgi:hypothetical protein
MEKTLDVYLFAAFPEAGIVANVKVGTTAVLF